MTRAKVEEVQKSLPQFIKLIEQGETILIISQQDVPIAEIRPIIHEPKNRRPSGLCKGEFTVPDDFDEPLSAEILNSFEG